ncbi:MAG: hypothetical protein A2017_13235 [Lentisphaerae bacterium GWF2_44_16]|nr:MAG: hypothetical protein A2017_13235 [Lentisphaerae bacterium GWF2_44_16]
MVKVQINNYIKRIIMNGKLLTALGIFFLICGISKGAADMEFSALNNYPVFKPEYTDIFYGKKPRVYLDGEWSYKVFQCSQNDYAKTVSANAACFEGVGTDWKKMLIPNYADASYGSEKIGAIFLSRDFTIPENSSGKRAVLTFTGIGWSPTVYINGKKAAEYRDLLPGWPTEFFQTDITPFLKPGKNVIAVALFKFRKTQRLYSSGIFNPVYIDLVEPVYAAETLVSPSLPDTINVKSSIINSTDKDVQQDLTALVENWKDGARAASFKVGNRTFKPGENSLDFSIKIEKPILWDIENPHLYSLKLFNGDKLIGWERFGLREFKVSGRDFILNGRKIHCYGVCAEEGSISRLMYVEGQNPQFLNNGGDCLRRYLKVLKENNCNSIMRWPAFTRVLNNLADEIGLLQFHMILPVKMYADDMPLRIKRQIVDKKKEIPEFFSRGYFYERGEPDEKTKNSFASRTKYLSSFTALVAEGKARRCPPEIFDIEGRNEWLKAAYEKLGRCIRNNPSVVAILSGDEGFRDCNQAFDLPVQEAALHSTCPGVLFTGEHSYFDTSTDLAGNRADCKAMLRYLDFANPATHGTGGSSMRAYPWPMFSSSIKYFSNSVYGIVGRKLPIFADEVLYYGVLSRVCRQKLWEQAEATVKALFPNGKLDKEKMIKMFSLPGLAAAYTVGDRHERARYLRDIQKKAGREANAWGYRSEIQLMGLSPELGNKNALFTAVAGRTKKMVEQARVNDQFLQGLGATTGPWFDYEMEQLAQLNVSGIGQACPIGKMFKQVYAPVFACLDFYGNRSSILAGETFKTELHVFNNSGSALNDIKVKVVLSGEKGEAFAMEITHPSLPPGEKATIPMAIPFDKKLISGDYRIALKMSASGRPIVENGYELYVFNSAEAVGPESKEKVYVYESYDPATKETFKRFMESLKLNVVYVPKEKLLEVTYYNRQPDKIKYLILSPRSIDHTTAGNMSELKSWLEKGGKLLCFEQDYPGNLPWAPETSYVRLLRKLDYALPATGADAIPLRYDDPLCKGLAARRYWESFNNPNGEMYRYLIAPLSADAKIIGLDVSQLEQPATFGALVIDRKVGEGRYIISQLEATKALEYQDGAARQYLNNLIGEWLKK